MLAHVIKLTLYTYGIILGGTVWFLVGGDAGDEGAVLELDDVLPDDVLGVVLEEFPELTVELESEAGKDCWVIWVVWCCTEGCTVLWATCIFETVLVWSVGINGVLSSDVGVGGANRDGPGCALKKHYIFKIQFYFYLFVLTL